MAPMGDLIDNTRAHISLTICFKTICMTIASSQSISILLERDDGQKITFI